MPYVRRFYYLPRDNAPKDTDVLAPCESLWKYKGTSLHTNHNQCKANSARPKSFQDLPNEEQIKQLQYKKILGMLNKMTPKKFQKLILQIGPESMDVTYVKMLAEIIFSKALVDEMYVNLYAKLCEEVTSTLPAESLDCFKRVLIDLCETGFNQLLDLTDNDIGCIHEDKRYTFKRRLMTLMRFIGEMSCLSIPFFDRIYDWHLTEQLIDKGDELHLEAVYFLLFTISLRSTDNAWTKWIENAVEQISYGYDPKGTGQIRSEIKFNFMALSDLRRGCLLPSYCTEWNRATDQDTIFNFHFISGSFPDGSNKRSKEIVEIMSNSSGFSNVKSWKVIQRVNSILFAHIIFAIDNQSFNWLSNHNFSVSFQSISICFKLLDSFIPLNTSSINKSTFNENQDSNASETDDSSSESDFDGDHNGSVSSDSSDSNSNGTTYGSAVGDNDMLEVLSKFGLTVKNGRVKKAELYEDSSESSTDNEDNLDENSTIEVENNDNLKSENLENSLVQINPTANSDKISRTNYEVKQILKTQEKNIKSNETAIRTDQVKQIENLQDKSINLLTKTDKSAKDTDEKGKNVLIKPGSSQKSRTALLNQFDEIIELKQNVKKNESAPVITNQLIPVNQSISSEKLATASTKTKNSGQSIPTEKLATASSTKTNNTSSSNHCKTFDKSRSSSSTKIENSAKENSLTSSISCFPDTHDKQSFRTQVKGKKVVLPAIPSHHFAFFGHFKGLFRLKNADFLERLNKLNQNANINEWKVVDRACITDNEAQITFTAPRSIISDLKKINYKVNFNSKEVLLNPVDFSWDEDIEKITTNVSDSSDFDIFEISITPLNFPNDLFPDETLKSLENYIIYKKEEYIKEQLSFSNDFEIALEFDAICVMKGWLLILCSNHESLNWILFLPFNSPYVLKHVGINITRINVSGNFPFKIDDNQLLEKISEGNNWLKDWKIVKREKKSKGALITFSIDAKSAHLLLKNKHMINLMKNVLHTIELVWEDLIRVVKCPQTKVRKISNDDISIKNDKVLFEGEFIYSCRYDTKSIFVSLVQCNKNVDFTTWKVVRRTEFNDGSVRLIFSADRNSLKCLDKISYNLFFNTQVIPLVLLNNQKWKDVLNFDDATSSSSEKKTDKQENLKNKMDEQQGFKYKIDEKLFNKTENKYSDYKPTKMNDRVTFQGKFPKSAKYHTKNILTTLTQCNKNVDLSSWSSVARDDLNGDVRLTLCADRDAIKCLKQFDFSLFYNSDTIKLSPISDKSWKDELEFEVIQTLIVPELNNDSNDIFFEGVFPKTKLFLKENFLQKLIQANSKLGMEKWKLIDKDCQNQNIYVLFSSDVDTLQLLKKAKYTANYGGMKIKFYPVDFDEWDKAFAKSSSARATTDYITNKTPDVQTSISNKNLKVPAVKNISQESTSSKVSSQPKIDKQLNERKNSNLPDVVQNAKPLLILFTGEFLLSSHLKNKTIKSILFALNPKLNSNDWHIMSRQDKSSSAILTFSADYKLLKPLQEANFKLSYNNTDVYAKPVNNISWDEIINIFDIQQYNDCVKSQLQLISTIMNASLSHMGNLKESLLQIPSKKGSQLQSGNVKESQLQSGNSKESQLQSGNVKQSQLQSSKKKVSQGQNVNLQLKDQKGSQVPSQKKNEKMALFKIVVPDSCDMKNKELYNCLLNCNRKLGVAKWTIVERQNVKNSARLIFKADFSCIRLLKDYQYRISYQKNRLLVNPMNHTWDEWERMLNPSVENSMSLTSSNENCGNAPKESYNYGTEYPIHLNDSLPSSSYSAPNDATHHRTAYPVSDSFPSTSINYKSVSNDSVFPTNGTVCVPNFPVPSACYSSPYRQMNDSVSSSSNLVITNKNFDDKQQSFSNSIPNLIGYKVAILPANFPSTLFTEEQFKRIETVLREYIYYEKVSNKLEFIPKFNEIKRFGGWMLILCHDKLTADWLVNLELEPWVKVKLTVVKED